MIINKVTFTGIDDSVDMNGLKKISKEKPFVEWGILYSMAAQGKVAIYPSEEYISTFLQHDMPIAVHLCGAIVGDLLKDENTPLNTIIENNLVLSTAISCARRIQLNFNAKKLKLSKDRLLNSMKVFPTTILQVNTNNLKLINEVQSLVTGSTTKVDYLFDASGGNGKEISTIPVPITGEYCGYAGGLNPENLERLLAKMDLELPDDLEIWIDFQTGVRTDKKFDLDKVSKCIEIAERYIKDKHEV